MVCPTPDRNPRPDVAAALPASAAWLEEVPAIMLAVDTDGVVRRMSRDAEHRLGHARAEVLGRALTNLLADADAAALRARLDACTRVAAGWPSRELCVLHADGRVLRMRETSRLLGDVAGEDLIVLGWELLGDASDGAGGQTDPLTGLMQRNDFEQELGRRLAEPGDGQARHALCLLDVNRLALVNETAGHDAGDAVLRQIARRLRAIGHAGDCVARISGDHFAVLLNRCSVPAARKRMQDFNTDLTEHPLQWGELHLSPGVSIGIAPFGGLPATAGEILRLATSACAMAKQADAATPFVLDDEGPLHDIRVRELNLVNRIDETLDKDRFELLVQPVVALQSNPGGSFHYELLTLVESDGQMVAPSAFLAAAERYRRGARVDRGIVRRALDSIDALPAALFDNTVYHINLCAQSLVDEQLLALLRERLGSRSRLPQHLLFEVTERTAVENLDASLRFISALRDLGCRFALDDFGKGHCSYSYLRDLPVDMIKIDGGFVRDIDENPINLALVASMSEIGHITGKQTVAECVESRAAARRLRDIGVDFGQGFALGRPQPIDKFVASSARAAQGA